MYHKHVLLFSLALCAVFWKFGIWDLRGDWVIVVNCQKSTTQHLTRAISSSTSARYRRSACIDTDMLWQWLVATWAEFQHSEVYCATSQCQKRLEARINAQGGHSEHLLWRWLPDIPVATHHNRFFSDPQMTTHNWLLRAFNVWKNAIDLQSDETVLHFTS